MESPSPKSASNSSSTTDTALAGFILLVALAGHFFATTIGWDNRNLPGVEFRQAQTAISAHFIQVEDNFSLAYPTPVLGKPWSIPLEFPLYQWTVVAVSNGADWPLLQSARAVSLGCFYLVLPALWVLFGRFGFTRSQRSLSLALVLSCPLYVFYSRAFLIETMALMFSVWFAVSFVELMFRRRWTWLALVAVMGTAAGLVKVTTFIVYLIPTGLFGAILLTRSLFPAATRSWPECRRTAAWGLGSVLLPAITIMAWTHFADAIKSANPQGAVLMSASMTQFNFAYGYFNVRFDADTWQTIFRIIDNGVLARPTLIALGLIGAIFGGRWRWTALASFTLFLGAPFIFPLLYAWHDYYFVANAVLLMTAVAFVIIGLGERRFGRLLAPLAVVGVMVSQGITFRADYYAQQLPNDASGPGIAHELHDLTADDEVIVIVGDDWNSIIPYYAQRRALMIRRDLEHDETLITQTFAHLADERVAALVLMHEQRDNQAVLDLAAQLLGISPDHFIEKTEGVIYLHESLIADMLPSDGAADATTLPSVGEFYRDRLTDTASMPPRHRQIFSNMTPAPVRFYFQFGPGSFPHENGRIVNAHTTTQLWFKTPQSTRTIKIECGLTDPAWQHPEVPTDGVEIRVTWLRPDGTTAPLFSHLLNPRDVEADRGTVNFAIPVDLPAQAEILIEALPGPANNQSCDWFYFGRIEL